MIERCKLIGSDVIKSEEDKFNWLENIIDFSDVY